MIINVFVDIIPFEAVQGKRIMEIKWWKSSPTHGEQVASGKTLGANFL
jgi:hypothetical protein